jgi:Protein of unknown function (DUF3592)
MADGMRESAAGAVRRPGGNWPTASRSRHRRRLAAIIAIIIAAMASVAFGVVSVAHAREFLAHHQTTGGVVTAVSQRTDCEETCTTTYDWTVRYKPPGSRPLTFTDYGNGNSTPVGTHVLVYYRDRDPGDARLDPGTGEEDVGITLIVVGLVGFTIDYWQYRVLRRVARGRAG